MNKTKHARALPLIATAMVSAFTLSSCGQSDNADTSTTAAEEGNNSSNDNNSSKEGKKSIPDNIAIDDRGGTM